MESTFDWGLVWRLAVLAAYLLLCRVVYCFVILHVDGCMRRTRRKHKGTTHPKKASHLAPTPTLVVLGSGGHTAEMITLMDRLPRKRFAPLHYVTSATDSKSEKWVRDRERNNMSQCVFHRIFRSREVGQSYMTSVLTTMRAIWESVSLVWKVRPQLFLVNGPGICLPPVVVGFVLHVLGLMPQYQVIFVESFCRVQSLSLSGILMRPFLSRFVVQWEELEDRWMAEYIGQLC